ncbi:MAG: carboxypeptidase regulatory-like domain-containing protein [Bryobacterales bacterium]|nr:carboxypeptidase regulatory-like domain-containing protein [Bryobacterales bacterium]
MKIPLLALVSSAALLGAVDGRVVNGATGKPQAGAAVNLVAMGGAGMDTQGSVKADAEGRFSFPQTPQGPVLLQVTHQGVTYSLVLQPGTPPTGLTLEVFDASSRRGSAKVVEDVVLLEPLGTELSVREHVIWQNDGKATYHDTAAGTFRFFAPPEAKSTLRVTAVAPGGLPVEQAATPAGLPDVFKIDFPVKPGETNFEVSYRLPFSAPGAFTGRAIQTDAPVRLAVPEGVVLRGDGIAAIGQDPLSRALVYSVKTARYTVQIEGSGAMPSAAADAEDAGSGLNQILPRIYGSVVPILGLAFLILALGFVLLYRKPAPVTTPKPPSPQSRKR